MKLKKDFVLRQIADTWVVVPMGQTLVDFNGMLSLNETGAFLWGCLEKGYDQARLVSAITEEYDVAKDVAEADITAFLKKLSNAGCFEM